MIARLVAGAAIVVPLAFLLETARRVLFGSAWDVSGAPLGLYLRQRRNRRDDSRFIDRTPIKREWKKKRARKPEKETARGSSSGQ